MSANPTATQNHHEAADGTYTVEGNRIELVARPPSPPAVPGPTVISILAAGLGMDGRVEVRGAQGVRVTSGLPPLPPMTSDSTNGVEVVVGETGNLTLQRGLLPVDQKIELTPTGITVDAGAMEVTIKSLTQITLSVCDGLAKITLGPEGVTVEALTIRLSAQVQAQLQAVMAQITGEAMTQISGGLTMIG